MQKWYEGLETPEERLYEESVGKVRDGVLKQGLSFDEAGALLGIEDAELRAAVLDDALKVLVAELHFAGKKPLKEVAGRLKLPVERLDKAEKEMLEDVKKAAIEKFKTTMNMTGHNGR